MNRCKIVSLLLPIWLTLVMQQAFYITVFAASNSVTQSEILSFVPVGASVMTKSVNATQKYKQLTNRERRFILGKIIFASGISGDNANRLAKDRIFIDICSKPNFYRSYQWQHFT